MDHMELARHLYNEAKEEYDKALKDGSRIRNACAKAWLSVIELVYYLLVQKGIKEEELPKNYRGIRFLLRRYADKDFRNFFLRVYAQIHQDGYYGGDIEPEEFSEYLEEIDQYLQKTNKLV